MHTQRTISKKWSKPQRTLNFKNSRQGMEEKKKEDYATEDPAETSAEELEKMAKEAIKKFKSLNQ